jgi:hypothetical protein
VVTRAVVTDADFDELFASIEDCYLAAYEEGLKHLSSALAAAADRQDGWLERVRCGIVAMLGFFDDHPSWARFLVLEAPVSASVTFERIQQLHGVLARLLDHRQPAGVPGGSPPPALMDDLIVGGVFSVIRTSLLENDAGKLVELAPSLMAFIVTPYLGQAAAQAELQGKPSNGASAAANEAGVTRARAISRATELPIRATHRTTLVLRAIAQAPYSNNREIAQAAGLLDEGQASKLLARLERQGVIENVGVGAARGEPNAWLLTASGGRTVELLSESFTAGGARPGRAPARGAR